MIDVVTLHIVFYDTRDQSNAPKGMVLSKVKDLYDKGISAWNARIAEINDWIAEDSDHRSVKVDFSHVDFRKDWGDVLDFTGFHFPKKGGVYFRHATFGENNVSFQGANFGDGGVFFNGATFGKGGILFNDATFGKGGVFFDDVEFGDGGAFFFRTIFGDGSVSFNGVTFGEGAISFSGATFGKGGVSFINVTFGGGNVFFMLNSFGGRVVFANLRNIETIKEFSLQYVDFKAGITFDPSREEKFSCVPDFSGSYIHGHFSTSFIRLNETKILANLQAQMKTDEITDASRALCRLKELAENNRDHQQALDYWALEMQVNNLLEKSRSRRVLLGIYDVASDYGRSIRTPFLWLAGLWLMGTAMYYCGSGLDAFLHSLNNTLPGFLRPAGSPADTKACGAGLVYWDVFQSLGSFVLLFLFGLGVRNRFRI